MVFQSENWELLMPKMATAVSVMFNFQWEDLAVGGGPGLIVQVLHLSGGEID